MFDITSFLNYLACYLNFLNTYVDLMENLFFFSRFVSE